MMTNVNRSYGPSLSEQRELVVQDNPERLQHPIAALSDVGVAEPELEPLDPTDVPGDVEVALADGGEPGAGRRVDRISALGVAQHHREPGDLDAREQGPSAEVDLAPTPHAFSSARSKSLS